MIWHTAPLHEVMSSLHTAADVGIPPDRQNGDGKNTARHTSPSLFKRVWQVARNPAQIVLLIGFGIAVSAAVYDTVLYGQGNWWQTAVLLVLWLLHVFWGAIPLYLIDRYEADVADLTAYTARVLRNKQTVTLPVSAVVPGDIVLLGCGDIVPADCRLIECRGVYCDETAIDGHSRTAEKRADLLLPVATPFNSRINMIYAGCTVLSGTATAVAVQTGSDTRAAQLAASQKRDRAATLSNGTALSLLRRYTAVLAATLCAVVVVCGIFWHMGIPAMLLSAAAVAFAVLCCAPTEINAWVRYGAVLRCRTKGALPVSSNTIEKASNVTMLCIEHTLSMTKNRPLPARLATAEQTSIPGEPLTEQLHDLLRLAVMSTGVEDEGDPADDGIRDTGDRCDAAFDTLVLSYPREAFLPYDSKTKCTAAVHLINGCHTLIVRGDLSLLTLCDVSNSLYETIGDMQREGLQVQAVICRVLQQVPAMLSQENYRSGCFVAGVLGFRDEIYRGTAAAVCSARRNGVRTVMFSDAAPEALRSYASALKLDMWGGIHCGRDIRACSDEQLQSLLDCSVWYDVNAEDRVRLIEAWKRTGYTVAAQGTAVEDLPVMRAADLAVTSAQNSSDAARQAADILQTDNGYAALAGSVYTARSSIFDRDAAAVYRLSCFFGLGIAAFLPVLWGSTPFSLTAVLLLILLTDILQAAGVTLCPESRIGIPPSHRLLRILGGLAATASAALVGTVWSSNTACLAAAAACVFSALFFRAKKPFDIPSPRKHLFLYIVGAAILLLTAIPVLAYNALHALYAIGVGLTATIVYECTKLLIYSLSKKEE